MPDFERKRIEIYGLPLDVIDIEGVVDLCREVWQKPGRIRIVTLNPLMVEAAMTDGNLAMSSVVEKRVRSIITISLKGSYLTITSSVINGHQYASINLPEVPF